MRVHVKIMTPDEKFNAVIAGSTVFVMFWAVAYVAPAVKNWSSEFAVAGSIASLLVSVGLYRLLGLSIRWCAERQEWLKSLVLGNLYVQGTWVGWFRGHNGEMRYMVEYFAQRLDSLSITGRSFDAAGREHGIWWSHAVSIDTLRGQLIFTYSFEGNDRSSQLSGIHASLLERSSQRAAPEGYAGIAQDLNDRIRIAVHAKKVCTTFLEWRVALERAKNEFADK